VQNQWEKGDGRDGDAYLIYKYENVIMKTTVPKNNTNN
jgi:hypothetical protein